MKIKSGMSQKFISPPEKRSWNRPPRCNYGEASQNNDIFKNVKSVQESKSFSGAHLAKTYSARIRHAKTIALI
ncbi:MAG: hypothetical protein U9R14_00925 [Patescibacteria group bacterium]|nr:hypothetical protein [Patescibacteria group bacterium]